MEGTGPGAERAAGRPCRVGVQGASPCRGGGVGGQPGLGAGSGKWAGPDGVLRLQLPYGYQTPIPGRSNAGAGAPRGHQDP